MDWQNFTYYTPHLDIPQLSCIRVRLEDFAFLVECRSDATHDLLRCNEKWIQQGFEHPVIAFPSEEDDAQRATPAHDDKPSAWLFPIWQSGKALWEFGTYRADINFPQLRRVSRRHFYLYLNTHNNWMVQNRSQFGMWINGIRLENAIGESSRASLDPDAPNTILAGVLEIIIYPIYHRALSTQSHFASYLPEFPNMELASQTSIASSVGTSASTLQPLEPPKENYYYLYNRGVPVQSQQKVFMAVHKRTGYRYIAKAYDQSAEERALKQYQIIHKLKVLQLPSYHQLN